MESDFHSKQFVSTHAWQIIRGIMLKYKDVVNRTEGNGLKLTKFHQLLHIPRYILKFGSPKNFNSGRCEAHHIKLSKLPASTAQQRQATFEQQVASRISDQMVLNRAFASLSNASSSNVSPELCGTKFYISCNQHDNFFHALPDKRNAVPLDYPQVVLDGVGQQLCDLFADNHIPCYTEHHRGEANQVIFRGNPNYRGSPWFDWCYLSWEDNHGNDAEIPAKILFFCDLRHIAANEMCVPGIYAVIHSMHSKPTLVQHSRLIRKGVLSTTRPYEICDVETISKQAFVYPNINKPNQFHIIPDRPSWSKVLFQADLSHSG
jgi:hypothetical protein